MVHDAEGALPAPSSEGSLLFRFRDHEDFGAVHNDLALVVAVACPAVEAAALAVGSVAFPNDNREAAPAYTENVALPEAWVEKLREALETRQEAQQALVAVAVAPALAIAREAFHLEKTLLASLPPRPAAPVSAPTARCRSWSAVAAMITPVTITSPSAA